MARRASRRMRRVTQRLFEQALNAKSLDPGYRFATAFAGLQTRTPKAARSASAMDGASIPGSRAKIGAFPGSTTQKENGDESDHTARHAQAFRIVQHADVVRIPGAPDEAGRYPLRDHQAGRSSRFARNLQRHGQGRRLARNPQKGARLRRRGLRDPDLVARSLFGNPARDRAAR